MRARAHHWPIALAAVVVLAATPRVAAQNVVDPGPLGRARSPISVTRVQVEEFLRFTWTPSAPSQAVRREVDAFCAGHPWRPFHSVLGISGFETYFAHPDELFFVLALAGPQASAKLRPLLLAELETHPPYAETVVASKEGSPRELYNVPPGLLPEGRAKAADLFGIYAFALFCQRFDHTPTPPQLAAVRARAQSLLERAYPFDPRSTTFRRDEAEHLNGDLAGLLAAWRLGHASGLDPAFEITVVAKIRELLELRLNLERLNLHAWTPTNAASKSLHNGKLARYLRLTPEVGRALRQWTDGAAAERLAALRTHFPTWWIARGDRLVGGENYTSPLHFSRALWQATAWCSDDPRRWQGIDADIPWCRADLAFIEKLLLR